MKIGILGTRGIPNHYGGFEQLAEYLSVALAERGHNIYVYNSSLHPYREKEYKNVKRITCFDPENRIGTAGQFVYDLNCIIDARKRNYDVLLQLGYTSSSVWSFLLPGHSRIITNMDGLEWKRTKYSPKVRKFLKYAEKLAIASSDVLIADSKGIQSYLKTNHGKDSEFIAYGAEIFTAANEKILPAYRLDKYGYYLLIARFEPENNIETIIKGYLQSGAPQPLVLIGSAENAFGRYLKASYGCEKLLFTGPVYDLEVLNNLRHFSALYFHGHSVGGTNPSLLEAMASQALICAHRNEFNSAILGQDAFYFMDEKDIAGIISGITLTDRAAKTEANMAKIKEHYTWKHIIDAYEQLMLKSTGMTGK